MRRSSTVELRTACGCTREVDLTRERELRSYLVPLYWPFEVGADFPEEVSIAKVNNCREFQLKGRFNEIGQKILEEVKS